jgi:hypothetical protein
MCTHPMQPALVPRAPSESDSIDVEYRGRLQLVISGSVTGNLYRFSPVHPVQQVDIRDALRLILSGRFGIAQ